MFLTDIGGNLPMVRRCGDSHWRPCWEGDSAVDRWQHLIQARGYRLIGETAKVKSELAVVAASEDAKFWAQFAPIVGDWEEASFTVAEAWQKAFQLAGDDPVALIEYAQWHDQCDRQSEAEDAFRRAAQLDTNDGRVWIAVGQWHQAHARDNEAQSAYLSALNRNLSDADKIQCTDFLLERVSQMSQQQRQEALKDFQTVTDNGLLFNKVTNSRCKF